MTHVLTSPTEVPLRMKPWSSYRLVVQCLSCLYHDHMKWSTIPLHFIIRTDTRPSQVSMLRYVSCTGLTCFTKGGPVSCYHVATLGRSSHRQQCTSTVSAWAFMAQSSRGVCCTFNLSNLRALFLWASTPVHTMWFQTAHSPARHAARLRAGLDSRGLVDIMATVNHSTRCSSVFSAATGTIAESSLDPNNDHQPQITGYWWTLYVSQRN